jgi:glutamate synthase (NADPH/NADH) small chain
MGDPRGFLKVERVKEKDRPIEERIGDWREVGVAASEADVRAQASRCMDCGIPFCHSGCPLGNLIPEWNDLVYRGRHDDAAERLLETNNFPEVTGRVCPAPCEASCVLAIDGAPVTIKTVERTIADRALGAHGFEPRPAARRTGKRVAVVGSGPAGLAVAQQLARAGHDVVVFERDDRVGGLLRYGIPDFKMEKGMLDRRIQQLSAEGVVFRPGTDVTPAHLAPFDATVLALGARVPRDLSIPGRRLAGVVFAMDFLEQQNRRVAGDTVPREVVATGKHVVVIGGGDTGSDCVGTSIRQGATSVTQIELMPRPPLVRMPANPWPEWPLVFRTSSSHEEGAERDWAISTKAFVGNGERVTHLEAARVTFEGGKVRDLGEPVKLPCDLALLAMGFTGAEPTGLVRELGVELDARGNVRSDASGATNVAKIFAAGDVSRGQSLVVWAIADGRRVAAGVDAWLATETRKPAGMIA